MKENQIGDKRGMIDSKEKQKKFKLIEKEMHKRI